MAHKDHVVVSSFAFIEPPGGKTKVNYLAVNAAPGEITDRMGGTAAGRGKEQNLGRVFFRDGRIGRRLNRRLRLMLQWPLEAPPHSPGQHLR